MGWSIGASQAGVWSIGASQAVSGAPPTGSSPTGPLSRPFWRPLAGPIFSWLTITISFIIRSLI